MAREFDHHVKDSSNSIRIDVYRGKEGYEWVHLNVQPLEVCWPRTTAIISLAAAAELAQALLDAVAAFPPPVPVGWETVDTDTD